MTVGGDGNQHIICSEETREKLREALKRRPKEIQDKFIYSHTPTKAVDQYTIDGKLIKEWKSISKVAKELSISPSLISAVCRGKQNKKTASGYVFRFKGEPFGKYSLEHKKTVRAVEWINDDNEVIMDFDSIKDAETYFGKHLNISNVCRGIRNHTCNLKFRYKNN